MSLLRKLDDEEMIKENPRKGENAASKDASPAQSGLRKQLFDGGCILLNIASTVTLVFLNKWYGFSGEYLRKHILTIWAQ